VGTGRLTRSTPVRPDARQLQRTLDQTSRLCLTAVEPRDQQARTVHAAAAAVRAVELLDGRARAAHPCREGPRPGADSDGTDAGEWPDPAARARAGLHVARTPDRSCTGGPTRPVSVIKLSGGRTAARTVRTLARGGPGRIGKSVDPCRWRAEGAPARASTLAGGDSLIFALVGRVGTGKGPDREEPMIVRHRPPCDRTYQW
jgi:hypothetical protein